MCCPRPACCPPGFRRGARPRCVRTMASPTPDPLTLPVAAAVPRTKFPKDGACARRARMPSAVIAHPDGDPSALQAPFHPHGCCSRRVFERVVHQVAQRHAQSLGVGLDAAVAVVPCSSMRRPAASSVSNSADHALAPGPRHPFPRNGTGGRRPPCVRSSAALPPGAAGAGSRAPGCRNRPGVRSSLGTRPSCENFRELPDGGKRRAELVGDGGDEVALHARHLHFAADGARDEVRAGEQEQHHHPGAEHQESPARRKRRAKRRARRQCRGSRATGFRPARRTAARSAAVALAENHAAVGIERGQRQSFAQGDRFQGAAAGATQSPRRASGAPPDREEGLSVHPQGGVRARGGLVPGGGGGIGQGDAGPPAAPGATSPSSSIRTGPGSAASARAAGRRAGALPVRGEPAGRPVSPATVTPEMAVNCV